MPKTKKAKPAPDLSTLAERAADFILEANRERLLDPGEATTDLGGTTNPYETLLEAAGLDFDGVDRGSTAFRRLLPSDDLRQAFDAVEEQRNQQGCRHERATWLLGIALGKRLARLDGGAR
jgi:hypothetical protein